MLTSFIVLVLVLGAGVLLGGGRPPWALQPATAPRRIGAARSERRLRRGTSTTFAVPIDNDRTEADDDTSIVMDSLRVLGLVRGRVERPVVGRRAYVRLWERLRALVVLTTIIITMGIMLAATIGILVLAAGFLLEQAIG